MNDDAKQLLEKKARSYNSLGTVVHIKFKRGYFMRGKITEVSNEFFMLDERKLGTMPIFYIEINDIEPFVYPLIKEAENGST